MTTRHATAAAQKPRFPWRRQQASLPRVKTPVANKPMSYDAVQATPICAEAIKCLERPGDRRASQRSHDRVDAIGQPIKQSSRIAPAPA